jgi:hypothetical protein
VVALLLGSAAPLVVLREVTGPVNDLVPGEPRERPARTKYRPRFLLDELLGNDLFAGQPL